MTFIRERLGKHPAHVRFVVHNKHPRND